MSLTTEKVSEIRTYEPAASGFVPIHPDTLRALCDEVLAGREQVAVAWRTLFVDDGSVAFHYGTKPSVVGPHLRLEPLYAHPPTDPLRAACEVLVPKMELMAAPASKNGSKAWKRGILCAAGMVAAALRGDKA